MQAQNKMFHIFLVAVTLVLAACTAGAGPLRERIAERRAAQEQGALDEEAKSGGQAVLPTHTRVTRDVAYGRDKRQRFDVYRPAQASGAPVIFMVHGGGWARGDKAARTVIENKVAHWVPRGYVFISTNYRLVPDADPLEQARDVAQALAAAQDNAASWGGDRNKFVLMGHSAGAHLVALLAASPALAPQWRGAVLLDSAALNVTDLMQEPHPHLYDRAFGSDSAYWGLASPLQILDRARSPILAVCSTQRKTACTQAARFVAKAAALGTQAAVLKQDLSHKDINQRLGEAGVYTDAVDAFLGTLFSPAR
ncbi:MAG: alpha/beta hydrolase fold domain-containing protein [Noviherbaspirillum sp.]